MQRSVFNNTVFVGLLPLTTALLFFCAQSFAVDAKNPVHDLQYGQALYAFYQKDNLQALTQLAIKDKKPLFTHSKKTSHIDDLLLSTALKLDYQMNLSALQLLSDDALENELDNTQQLWLYLAQRFYDKQLFAESALALKKVLPPKASNSRNLWNYLKLQHMLKQQTDNLPLAINNIEETSIYYAYAAHNLATAHYQQQNYQAAFALIDKAIKNVARKTNQEALELHQHMLITAAFMYFYQHNNKTASRYFNRLSIDSLFIDKALLGFAQMIADQGDAILAISIYERAKSYPLASIEKIKSLNQQALLIEQQGHLIQALENFDAVNQLCQQVLDNLHKLNQAELLSDTLAFHEKYTLHKSSQWDKEKDQAFIKRLMNNGFLLGLINDQAYLAQLQNLQDLHNIEARLQQWLADMPIFEAIIVDKKNAFNEKIQWAAAQPQQESAEAFNRRYQLFTASIEKIRQTKNSAALLSSQEKSWQQQIQRIELTLSKLQGDAFYTDYQEMLRRIKGVFTWQASEQYHSRIWNSQKSLAALKKAIDQRAILEHQFKKNIMRKDRFHHLEKKLALQKENTHQTLLLVDQLKEKTTLALTGIFSQQWIQEQQSIINLQKSSRIAIARISEKFLESANE